MKIKLFNSLRSQVEEFTPLKENVVRIYSCGPTVYNYAHIGNMRAFLFADLLQRTLTVVGGYDVKWVMNITDIDDKTIRDSSPGSGFWRDEMGKQSNDPHNNLKLFTDYYRKAFFEDISLLGINLSHFYCIPNATEYIPQMQELIRKIYNKGLAYVSDGSVYFDVNKYRDEDHYGKLFHIDFENFRAGVRIDADQYEREQVSDFALWKAAKPGEPSWDFELGGSNCLGRPGWHIECSAMEYDILGLPFDIHTGGIDLKFPHHEDEIAQSKAGYGIEPTSYWCHNEFLEVEGQKMSKSLGNFFTLRDLLSKGIDPLDIRYLMLSAHYGSKLNFTFDGITSARKARLRVQEYIYQLHNDIIEGSESPDINSIKEEIMSGFANDLHTPKSLGALFTFLNKYPVERLSQPAKDDLKLLLRQFNDIFNVWGICPKPENSVEIPGMINELAEQRFQAKKEKNFELADQLRKKIQDCGWLIHDKKDSYELERIC